MSPTGSDLAPVSGPETLEELLRRLRPRIQQIFAVYHVPPSDAEDLLQDVLVVALRKWESIHVKDGWLVGTLRNKCLRYWRRRQEDRLQTMDLPALESLCAPLPPLQERAERMLDLATLTADLCRRHREILWLRYGLGLSSSEIAARTGYRGSSIRKLSCRSVSRLQKKI